MPASSDLTQELAALPPSARETLERYHFDVERFRALAARVRAAAVEDNVVRGAVEPPRPDDVRTLPDEGTPEYERFAALGRAELAAGRVALVVLAGGMATRMGGVVKALVPALDGHTFLDLRLREVETIALRHGATPPLWLMASNATEAPLREALGSTLDGDRVAVFSQFVSLRLNTEGGIFLDEQGEPSEHASGHGDLPEALQRSGLIQRFVARGGRVVMVTNLDNLGGAIDPAIIGWHLDQGAPVTSEVVGKLENDRGGIPVRVDGKLCVLEEFRIPESFDPATVRVFNTNTFHFDARALSELQIPWTFFRVKKKVGPSDVIQFKRLINEVTSHLETRYLHVPRTGPGARFLPVKDNEELGARRGEIELVATARGWLR